MRILKKKSALIFFFLVPLAYIQSLKGHLDHVQPLAWASSTGLLLNENIDAWQNSHRNLEALQVDILGMNLTSARQVPSSCVSVHRRSRSKVGLGSEGFEGLRLRKGGGAQRAGIPVQLVGQDWGNEFHSVSMPV